MTLLVVATMCAASLLTAGRTAAAEHAALAHIDDLGTRTIVVRAQSADAAMGVGIVADISRIQEVESVAGFSNPVDVWSTPVPGGSRVGLRVMYVETSPQGTGAARSPERDRVWASPTAARDLGLADGVGSVSDASGHEAQVAGILETPDHLRFLEPLLFTETQVQDSDALAGPPSVTTLVIVATSASTVETVTGVVQELVGADHPRDVTLETSTRFARLRAAVGGDLGRYGRDTVLGVTATCAALVMANMFGLVLLRRRDFGRRRALGASQALIVTLLLTQVAAVGCAGAVVGSGVGLGVLLASGAPVPPGSYVVAVSAVAVGVAVVGAVPPAFFAARRDPLRELRVP